MLTLDATLWSSTKRLLYVLEMAPWVLRTTTLIELCGRGMASPSSSIRRSLNSLKTDGLVAPIANYCVRGDQRWASCKWDRAPERVLAMSESLRERLPTRRRCITQTVRIRPNQGGKQTIHYSIGLYPDGRPAELFIDVAKAGAALRGWCGEVGMMLSIALQHGTPLPTILDLFVGTCKDPCGVVEGHPRILHCSSIMDLIARDMGITFLNRDDWADVNEWSTVPVPVSDKSELPPPVEGQTCVCHEKSLRTDSGT